MGYHTRDIKKGVFGEFSKVQEEWDELLDARTQNGKILELVEIADLYGAIEGYLEKKFGLNMEDVAKMSHMTKTAFLEGKRVSSDPMPTDPPLCVACQLPEEDVDEDMVVRVRDDGKYWCQYCWHQERSAQ